MSTLKRIREENQMLRQKVRALEAKLRQTEQPARKQPSNPSLRQLSRLSGIPVSTIRYRVYAGYPNRKLTVKDGYRRGNGRALHEYKGSWYTIYRIAKMTGFSESRLRYWMSKGRKAEDIIEGEPCKR